MKNKIFNAALREAHAAIKSGKKEDALHATNKALAEEPKSLDALLLAVSLSEPSEALEFAKQAFHLYPRNQRAAQAFRWAEQRVQHESKKESNKGIQEKDSKVDKSGLVISRAVIAGVVSFFLIGFFVLTWFGFPQITVTIAESTSVNELITSTPFQYILPTATRYPTSLPTSQPQPTLGNNTAYYARSWEIENPQAGTDNFWIEVDLSEQLLNAWRGDNLLASFLVSTGTRSYPTVTGSYKVYAKYSKYTMAGPGYYLPDVPYSLFFYKGYSIHGTYWHDNFGTPMSHGCVNMTISDAAWIYDNAPIGTVVFVHP